MTKESNAFIRKRDLALTATFMLPVLGSIIYRVWLKKYEKERNGLG